MPYKDEAKRREYDRARDATPERREAHRVYATRQRPSPLVRNPNAEASRKIRVRYGMSIGDYERMFNEQGGKNKGSIRCTVCGDSKAIGKGGVAK
jgi:hypothetical protein